MKNGKNPTRRQKQITKGAGSNPDNWLVFKVESDRLHLIHRHTSTTKTIYI